MSATSELRTGGRTRPLGIWVVFAAVIVTAAVSIALLLGRPASTVAPPTGVSERFIPGWSGWSNANARRHQEINSKMAKINRQDEEPAPVPVCEPCVERYQQ